VFFMDMIENLLAEPFAGSGLVSASGSR